MHTPHNHSSLSATAFCGFQRTLTRNTQLSTPCFRLFHFFGVRCAIVDDLDTRYFNCTFNFPTLFLITFRFLARLRSLWLLPPGHISVPHCLPSLCVTKPTLLFIYFVWTQIGAIEKWSRTALLRFASTSSLAFSPYALTYLVCNFRCGSPSCVSMSSANFHGFM